MYMSGLSTNIHFRTHKLHKIREQPASVIFTYRKEYLWTEKGWEQQKKILLSFFIRSWDVEQKLGKRCYPWKVVEQFSNWVLPRHSWCRLAARNVTGITVGSAKTLSNLVFTCWHRARVGFSDIPITMYVDTFITLSQCVLRNCRILQKAA